MTALVILSAPVSARSKPDRLTALVASTDGATKETAYRVASVDEEYQILRVRHLRASQQALVMGDDGHPYDMLTTTDQSGATVKLWFDIKSFYGLGF